MTAELLVQFSTDSIIQYTLNGLSRGVLIFLIAMGLTLIFGLLGLINFAHGALFTLGGYVAISVVNVTGSYWVGLLVAVLAVGVLGLVLERALLHRLYDREPLLGFLATFGIGLVIEELISIQYGSQSYGLDSPFPGSVEILGSAFPAHRLFLIGVGIATAVVVSGVLQYTRIGLEIHATTVDESTAETLGVDSTKVYTLTFVVGVMLAALAGTLAAPITAMSPGIGTGYMLTAFLVVIIGGMGSFKGSFVASLIVGIIESFGAAFVRPTYVTIGVFLLAMVFIVYKPTGLFGNTAVME